MQKLLLVSVFCLLGAFSSAAFAQDSTEVVNMRRLDFKSDPREYVIGSLSTVGLTTINDELLLSTTGLAVGDVVTIPGDILSDAARKLWDQRHFSDVKVSTDFRGDTVDVTFHLKERLRVGSWNFEGATKSDQKELTDNRLKLRRKGELSTYVLNTTMDKIRSYYNEKGFRNANISYRIEPDTSGLENYVIVTFVVSRNKKVRVGDIVFQGNDNIPTKQLTKAMEKTKKVSINFFNETKFNDKEFPEDLEKIEAHYRSKGYRDARVLADSLFKIKDNRIGVWIKVDEGKKYYYRDISWIGNSKIATEYLNDLLGLEKGDVYDSEAMGRRLGTIAGKPGEPSISTLYSDDGYLAFKVEPVERVIGDSIDVEIRIIEGNQFRIRDIIFDGNTRTNDHVIRREMDTRPGDLYSQTLLMRTYQRLATMGQFDRASFSAPQIIPNMGQETVDIKYSLQEKSNDQFEVSGGFGGGMFIASVGINFTNISLRKFFDHKAWRPYPAGDNQILGLKVQSNGTYYQAGSITFTEPWLGGRKPTSLSVNFYTSRETNAYYWGLPATKYFGTIGGSVSIGKRINWPDPYFSMSFGISMQTYNLNNWDYFLVKNGSSNVLALSFVLSRNSIDDPYQYSTRGSEVTLSVTATPPYSLFDGQDYSNKKMSDNQRYQWIEYHKWKFNTKWFFPLTADNKLVFMARAQFGFLGYYNRDKPSPFEGFQVGGDGLAGYNLYGVETIGLRGYENASLTPEFNQGKYASVYSKYTAELRYPLVNSEGTMIYGLIFAEAGNAFSNLWDFKPFNLKRSAGVGLRVFLPILGMLGLDWGYGFDSVPGKSVSGGQLHFTMGMQL